MIVFPVRCSCHIPFRECRRDTRRFGQLYAWTAAEFPNPGVQKKVRGRPLMWCMLVLVLGFRRLLWEMVTGRTETMEMKQ